MIDMQDPVAVHANMLRGTIAKPSWANILHLYPVEALALVGAAYADAAEEIHKTIDECAAFNDKHGQQVLQRLADCLSQRTVPTDATAALERVKAEARAEGLEMAAVKADAARQKYAIATYQSDDGRLQNAARCYCADEIAIDIRAMKGEGA